MVDMTEELREDPGGEELGLQGLPGGVKGLEEQRCLWKGWGDFVVCSLQENTQNPASRAIGFLSLCSGHSLVQRSITYCWWRMGLTNQCGILTQVMPQGRKAGGANLPELAL